MANLASLFGNTPFKPAEVEEVNLDFSPLPKGQYPVIITESEIRPNNAGTGTNLTLKLQVIEGKQKNRIVFENLCVQHINATAQAIAQTRLKQICESLKVSQLKDTIQLHDKPLLVTLDVELDRYQTEKSLDGSPVYRNTIKGYAPMQAGKSSTAQAEPETEEFEDTPF